MPLKYSQLRNTREITKKQQKPRNYAYGSEGYRFESCRRHKIMQRPVSRQVAFVFGCTTITQRTIFPFPALYSRQLTPGKTSPSIKSIRNPSGPIPDHSNNIEISISEKRRKRIARTSKFFPKEARSPSPTATRQCAPRPSYHLFYAIQGTSSTSTMRFRIQSI